MVLYKISVNTVPKGDSKLRLLWTSKNTTLSHRAKRIVRGKISVFLSKQIIKKKKKSRQINHGNNEVKECLRGSGKNFAFSTIRTTTDMARGWLRNWNGGGGRFLRLKSTVRLIAFIKKPLNPVIEQLTESNFTVATI